MSFSETVDRLFDPPKALGLVLDISFRKAADGKRLSAKVRQQLVEVAEFLEGEDALYLYQIQESPGTDDGERTSLVGNWEAAEFVDIGRLLNNTLCVLSSEDPDGPHHLCLISDHLNDSKFSGIIQANSLRQKAGMECSFLVVGIGNSYDEQSVKQFCESQCIEYHHCGDVMTLSAYLNDWIKAKNANNNC